MGNLLDVGAIRVIVKNQAEIKHVADKIKSRFRVIKEHDYYAKLFSDHPYYKAIHLTIIHKSKPVEIQIKTSGHNKIHKRTHAQYKTYHPLPSGLKKRLVRESEQITKIEN